MNTKIGSQEYLWAIEQATKASESAYPKVVVGEVTATDESLLTSRDRKNTLKQLIVSNSKKVQLTTIRDPLEIIIGLYLSESDSDQHKRFVKDLRSCRINPNSSHQLSSQRDDVEFYIPQLVSYIAFHSEFRDENLVSFLKQAGSLSQYFAHLVFFYIRSLSQIVSKKQNIEFKAIYAMMLELQLSYSQIFIFHKSTRSESLTSDSSRHSESKNPQSNNNNNMNHHHLQSAEKELMKKYGTSEEDECSLQSVRIRASKVVLDQYTRIVKSKQDSLEPQLMQPPAFQSTIDFFDDLIQVSEELKNADPKIIALRTFVKRINEALPAAVYVPFLTNQLRQYYILNIVPSECRVFSTKERSPYYICLELFNPDEEDDESQPTSSSTNPNVPASQTSSSSIRRIPDWRRQFDSSKPITVQEHFNNSQSDQTMAPYERERRASMEMQFEKRRQSAFEESASYKHQQQQQLQSGTKLPEMSKNNSQITESGGISSAYENETPSQLYKDTQSAAQALVTVTPFSANALTTVMNQEQPHAITTTTEAQEQQNHHQQQISQRYEINIQSGFGDSIMDESATYDSTLQASFSPSKALAKKLFGEEEQDQTARIRRKSPYGHFKTWRLVHFIVKTGDNLKQEELAQQLIYQFDSIFKDSGLNLKLRPYEIASLGPDSGIIEVVKNSVTIDSLKRKLSEEHKQSVTLESFFKSFYGESLYSAQMNFCSSLAAYSLVCYFLQIKDRHNGNILLHRDGYITHIDFGFLISNAPGKGLAFENNVPFKLLTEYVDVLGGLDSELFKTFRYLFFKGFQAARKHQDKILILVKMLYSSQGGSLPCFEKGEEAITALQQRFNPPSITIDSETFVHTNELINRSLDNWKSRWYDKWQYFCQGIFY